MAASQSHVICGCKSSVKTLSFDQIDPEDLLQRLTLFAYSLFGSFPDPRFEPVIKFHGASPEDLAIETLTRLLDPDDHKVEWNAAQGPMTRDGLLGYLKTVLFHDFIDMKRKGMYKASVYMPLVSDNSGDDGEMTLDDFIAKLESPEARTVRKEQQEELLARFNSEPELKELLTVQLDPNGYQAYTNQDLAKLLGTTVDEIENRKKRLMNRLLKVQKQAQAQRG
jgi:DNA-directed RNA polymerase specialized sigma24 family protein